MSVPDKQKEVRLTIRQLIEGEAFREQVARALPKHLTPERFIRVAVTAMNRVPKLAQCDQGSFFNALLTLSQLGLEPDGRRAHLIPYENRKKGITECQLIVDYKGIVELISNAGDVANIHADVVCDNDQFVYDKGVIVSHVIDFRQPRGAVYAAYALIRFKDGTEKTEVMNREEIEAIRKRSKAGESGPWTTDWNEMAKKTVFRRASKWVKLSPEQHDVIERDDDQFPEIHVPRPPISMPMELPAVPEESKAPVSEAKAEGCIPEGDVTGPQIQTIQSMLTKLKITDDMARHEKVSNILALERVIVTMKELTKKQASEVIGALEKEIG